MIAHYPITNNIDPLLCSYVSEKFRIQITWPSFWPTDRLSDTFPSPWWHLSFTDPHKLSFLIYSNNPVFLGGYCVHHMHEHNFAFCPLRIVYSVISLCNYKWQIFWHGFAACLLWGREYRTKECCISEGLILQWHDCESLIPRAFSLIVNTVQKMNRSWRTNSAIFIVQLVIIYFLSTMFRTYCKVIRRLACYIT